MPSTFPEEIVQEKCGKIINEILGNSQLKLFISNFILKENDKDKKSYISCTLIALGDKKTSAKIKGEGDGFVDALFNAVIANLSNDFCSLKKFSLAIKNLDNKRLYFTATARSLVVAAISAIRKAISFLINIELSVIRLHKSIKDAAKRSRMDLVQEDTMRMTDLVRIVSYEETIANLKTI